MCGIAGYLGPERLEEGIVERTLGLMRRRGPDHQGHRHYVTPSGRHVHLLHARLKILDLEERSNQPFSLGQKHLIYNGETYNYVEVRRELASRGRSFRTTSDTEVLLTAIDELGPESALDRAEGMWAFALYDGSDGSLLLSRDRFGEKPLFILRDGERFYFASEIKALAAMCGRRLEVDLDHLRRYLVNGYKALYKKPQSFYQDVTEVPAGVMLRVSDDRTEEARRYWTPPVDRIDHTMTYDQAVEGIRERLVQAVKIRLRADVPLAFCMSGGVDSNALISIAKRTLGYDVHGFTITSSDERYDESEMVEQSVRELGLRHTPVPATTSDFLPRLRQLVSYHDAPVYTITYYAHWLLMQSIADHGYRISVSGTAADELFSGYYDHHLFYLREVAADPTAFATAREAWETHVRPVVRNPFLSDPRRFVENPDFRDHVYLDAEAFSECLTSPWQEPFAESHYSSSLLRNRMLNELFHEAVPVILHEDDLNAMYYSIENRSPFLDRQLFEFAFRIPPRHLVRNGYAKAVLRDAIRGVAPDAIVDNRQKVGFNASIFSFLDVTDPTVRAQILDQSPIFDIVRREKIEEFLGRGFLPNSQSKFLFYFLCSKIFLEECAR